MKYTHIIWDWNGTLLDDAFLCLEVINSLLTERNLPTQTMEEYREIFDFPVIKYYERLGFDLEKEGFENVSTEFINRYEIGRNRCLLHDHTREVLEKINKIVASQNILSAYEQTALEGAIEEYDLAPYFNKLVGHDSIHAPGKTENGRKLVDSLSAPKSSILLIGDTTHDYEVAHSIGIQCLLIDHGHHSSQRLKACDAPVVSSLHEAETWLKKF